MNTVVKTAGTANVNITPALKTVIELLEKAGLKPTFGHPYRGGITLSFGVNVGGVDGTFGGLDIGVVSGKLLSATVKYGNSGPSEQFTSYTLLIAELRALPKA